MMNSRPKQPKYARNKNVLVVGGSGSGKTRFFVKPNLMQMHSSYLVSDPKGTLLLECGKLLERGSPKLGEDGKPVRKNGKLVYEPYVFNNVGFSSASGLYALPVRDAVLQRAEKTLAERTQAQAAQRTEKDVIYTMHTNPRSESLADRSFLQAYEQQPDGKAIPGDLLFVGTPEKCRELLQSLNAGELTQGEVKALYAKAQEPDRDSFFIYQLKRGDETRDLRFEPYDRLTAAGHTVDPANYDLIYSAPLAPGTSLEAIFTRFNIDHPKDFKGHSLSVSDVVVLHQNGQDTAHYVDSIGYRQTPEFLQPQNYLKHVEDIVEQNDNNFDGIINNTPQTPTVGELEQKAKAGEPISLIDLTNAIHADKERGKEEKPSIRAQLRAAKEQTAQRKAQRSKTQDLERN